MNIFLDANVLFSASNKASNIHRFILLLRRDHSLMTSDYAFEEARRNITVKRHQWIPTFNELKTKLVILPSAPLTHPVTLVEKDRPILGAAIAYRCDYLLTGDKKDFGHLYHTQIATVIVVDYLTLAQRLLA